VSNIVYDYGSIDDYSDVVTLCKTWWEDSSFYKNTGMEFIPDYNQFKSLDDDNSLFVITGRVKGKLVACYVAVISPYIFNSSVMMASEVVWCLDKEYQKGREVFGLLNAIETGLTNSNIDMFNLNLPVEEGKKSLAEYLTRKKNYWKQDISIMKNLEDSNNG